MLLRSKSTPTGEKRVPRKKGVGGDASENLWLTIMIMLSVFVLLLAKQ
jgi:hypothetical protein